MATRLLQGHGTTITFASDASLLFYPRALTPPGLEGGGPIETTLLAATAYRMFEPKTLKTLMPFSITALYDPDVYTDMIAAINTNTLITITFNDSPATVLAFYGYVNRFAPGTLSEGDLATAELEIVPTLRHSSTGAETAPVVS